MTRQLCLRASLVAFSYLLLACDDRQAWQTPEPGLERMLQQHRADPYAASSAFADGRSMRTPPPDTIARSRDYLGNLPVSSGRGPTGYVSELPLPLSRALLERGRTSFDEVCATCHGVLADGVSVVAEKMTRRKPPSLFEPRITAQPRGRVFATISHGYGLMPGYAPYLSVDQRWAVVAYLDVLRASRAVKVADLPASLRAELAKVAP